MTHYLKISMLLVALAVKDCANFEEPVLDHSSQIAKPELAEKGVPALVFNKGYIDDFSGEIYGWWTANDQIAVARKGDTLKCIFRGIGGYTPFGREFTALDFSEANAVKIRMRAEGKSPVEVRLDLKDASGHTANSSAPSVKVPVGKGYEDFYFPMKDKWKQGWDDAGQPVNNVVDNSLVSALMFFVNPGKPGWDGVIYIDEIVAYDINAIPKKEGSAGGVIDSFDDVPYSWWTGSSKIAVEKLPDQDVLKVTSTGAGANYETFGRGFDLTDFSKAPIIRVRARAINDPGQAEAPKLRFSLKDKDGFVANEFDVFQRIDTGATFKDYFFDFKGKYSQTYPDKHTVDPTSIQDVLIFINSGGPAYNGNIYLDEIEVITEKKYQELKSK